jgi:hypothetical protein
MQWERAAVAEELRALAPQAVQQVQARDARARAALLCARRRSRVKHWQTGTAP